VCYHTVINAPKFFASIAIVPVLKAGGCGFEIHQPLT